MSQEDDDKYMKIDYIEGERAADYVAPDEDEIQQYNTYRELDEWGMEPSIQFQMTTTQINHSSAPIVTISAQHQHQVI